VRAFPLVFNLCEFGLGCWLIFWRGIRFIGYRDAANTFRAFSAIAGGTILGFHGGFCAVLRIMCG
jgi:hypothetical protein